MRLGVWALALGLVTSTHAWGDEPVDPPPEDPAPPLDPVEPPPVEPPPVDPVSSDDMIDPSELVTEEPRPPAYPRAFVERPLLLPRRLREVSFGMGVVRETAGDVRLRYLGANLSGRRGFDGVELSVGGNVVVFHDDNIPEGYEKLDIPVFQRLYVGMKLRVADEIAIGMTAVLGNALSKRRRYSPSLFVQAKLRPSERGAIFLSGGGDYNYANEDDDDDGFVSHRLSVFASGTAMLQLTKELALQAAGSAVQSKYVDPVDTSYRTLSGSVSLLISATERVDLAPYVSISSVGEVDTLGGGVTVMTR